MNIPKNIPSRIEEVLNRVNTKLNSDEYKEMISNKARKNKCPLCDGKGVIYNSYRKRYSICKCQRSKNIARSLSKFNADELEKTFKNFNDSNLINKNMKNATTNYYLRFENIRNSMSNSFALLGVAEEERTHLVLALANKFIFNNDVDIEYISLKKPLKLGSIHINRCKNVDLLIINDFLENEESLNNISLFISILKHRSMKRLPIVISSNINLNNIKVLNEDLYWLIKRMTKGNIFDK
ncbi:hypothetical protein [Clostridium perfringens]|uniref:hypothetical protein n=1 Tax=Clostridium perfringens TaxID=1502 RepID=UPI002468E06C|nr:hypothetical protein [Clostridium perfringens]MDH5085203.1 hypothetical protein [Clostridium perfringens]